MNIVIAINTFFIFKWTQWVPRAEETTEDIYVHVSKWTMSGPGIETEPWGNHNNTEHSVTEGETTQQPGTLPSGCKIVIFNN